MTSRSIADSLTPAAPFDAPRRAPELDLDTFFDVSLDLLVVRDINGPVLKASASWFSCGPKDGGRCMSKGNAGVSADG